MTIVLVRHGQTRATKEGRFTGRNGVELDDEGRRQVSRLARRLAVSEFSVVLTSPLVRAWQTCDQAGFGGRAERLAALVEWDYGELEGKVAREVRRTQPGWSLFEHGAPGGESPGEVADRVDEVVARIGDSDGDVLVVSHGHLLRSLITRWIGLEMTFGDRIAVDPASLSLLGERRGQPTVLGLNDTSHLTPVWPADHG